MTNTISIDTNVYKSAESFARNSNISIREFVEQAILAAMPRMGVAQQDSWRKYKVSPEVMAMTFEERKDIPEDYTGELQEILDDFYF